MARIRTIKPEFFTSEDVVSLSPFARLLYVALWCEADREGRLRWKPRTLKMRYFPADDIDIAPLCGELLSSDMVRLYGDDLAYIPTFGRHQHVNPRESKSELPDPTDIHASPRVAHASPRDSDAQVGREGKGRELIPPTEAADAATEQAPDETSVLWRDGTKLLAQCKLPERSAKSNIGRWLKSRTAGQILSAIRSAHRAGTQDPIPYVNRVLSEDQSQSAIVEFLPPLTVHHGSQP